MDRYSFRGFTRSLRTSSSSDASTANDSLGSALTRIQDGEQEHPGDKEEMKIVRVYFQSSKVSKNNESFFYLFVRGLNSINLGPETSIVPLIVGYTLSAGPESTLSLHPAAVGRAGAER